MTLRASLQDNSIGSEDEDERKIGEKRQERKIERKEGGEKANDATKIKWRLVFRLEAATDGRQGAPELQVSY